MKKLLLTALMTTLITSTLYSKEKMNTNPLLQEFETPFQTPPFDKIKITDYKPAIEEAIKEAHADIDAIIANKQKPTFQNTIVALEHSGAKLGKISAIFFNLNNAETSEEMQKIAVEIMPALTEIGNYISLNEELFKRVKSVYDSQKSLNLSQEDLRLLEKKYKDFALNGAELSPKDKKEYNRLTMEMSNLSVKFEQNLLNATNAFTLNITKADTDGLPQYVKDAAAAEAKARDLEGYVITLQAPSMIPFMENSSRRDLREKVWKAYNTRCIGGEFDNQEIIKQLTSLRLQVAKLLGYKNFADYRLQKRMAKSDSEVITFLNKLLNESLPFAKKEVAEVEKYGQQLGLEDAIMPWDFSFYSQKLKKEKYSIDDEQLKPYFKLENLQQGMFDLAGRLYGLTFKKNKNIPIYNPDVKTFEVYDKDGSFLAVLYLDYFPRASKSGGAWMTSFRETKVIDGKELRPQVSLVCNFTKPTEATPSLLTFMEVTTLLHEFGHALHGMLAKGTYDSVTGTNVANDFVELPSQIMENWATEKEFLSMWAKHYKTGEAIPDSLVNKIIAAKNYNSGYLSVRQLSFGINDMAWHTITEPITEDVYDFEKKAISKTSLFPTTEKNICFSPSFSHIFGGGYSAGYYSYKWAEVLEADAFSLFKEKGVFNKDVAESFRKNILERGDIEPAMDLFVRFRGREPRVEALSEKLGLK